MIPHKLQERVRSAEAWMVESFGTTHATYMRKRKRDALDVYVSETVRILDKANVRTLIQRWREEELDHSTRGRKAVMDECAALGIMLVQMRINGELLFTAMKQTIEALTDEQLTSLGIRTHDVDNTDWYHSLWRAVDRLQTLVDPHPGNRHKRPTRAEYRAILAARDPEECAQKQKRLMTLCNALVDASVQLMPRDLRRRYRGNVALDATRVRLNGWLGGPSNKNPRGPHRSVNYDGGWYVRNGNHDGSDSSSKSKREWAIEAEIATMTANVPGEAADFPLLAHGVSFHKPGKIAGEAGRLVESLIRRGYRIDHFIADRAYLPSSKPHELQAPLRDLGARLVFDYKMPDRAITAHYEDLIQVGGQWYVHYMPEDLINAEALYHSARETAGSDKEARNAAKELRNERILRREKYRLKPKGRHRSDGSRQYMYPNPKQYGNLAVDYRTGEVIPCITKKTIVVKAASDPAEDKALKHAQEYPYQSAKWAAFYGLRNTVESFNAYIKDPTAEDIDSPMKRRARGNTFASLAITLALVSANVRKILTFIEELLARIPRTSINKTSPKTYYSGTELPRRADAAETASQGSPPPGS